VQVVKVTDMANTMNGLKFELENLHKRDKRKRGCVLLFNDAGMWYSVGIEYGVTAE
jgi:hypothetical protein